VTPHRRRRPRPGTAVAAAFALAALAVACGDDEPSVDLSPTAAEGRQIANSRGCAGCHGSDGAGGVGPSFVGLAGSQVQLEDGTTVVADEEYLVRSIVDPGAQLVDGYSLRMPEVSLTDDEVAKLVQYIQELGTTAATTAP
jgi:cytochrome c oxidase subunit 2